MSLEQANHPVTRNSHTNQRGCSLYSKLRLPHFTDQNLPSSACDPILAQRYLQQPE